MNFCFGFLFLSFMSRSSSHQTTENQSLGQALAAEDESNTNGLPERTKNRAQSDYVRFFPEYAITFDVRTSAFLYHLAAWTKNKHKFYKEAYEYDPAQLFGEAVGVSCWQIYRIARKLKAAKLIDFKKTKNGTKFWITDNKVYRLLAQNDYFSYRKSVEEKLGINGSILYRTVQFYTENERYGGEGWRTSPEGVNRKFPWMTPKAARRAMERLVDAKLIVFDLDGCLHGVKRFFAIPEDGNITELTAKMIVAKTKIFTPAPAPEIGVRKVPASGAKCQHQGSQKCAKCQDQVRKSATTITKQVIVPLEVSTETYVINEREGARSRPNPAGSVAPSALAARHTSFGLPRIEEVVSPDDEANRSGAKRNS